MERDAIRVGLSFDVKACLSRANHAARPQCENQISHVAAQAGKMALLGVRDEFSRIFGRIALERE